MFTATRSEKEVLLSIKDFSERAETAEGSVFTEEQIINRFPPEEKPRAQKAFEGCLVKNFIARVGGAASGVESYKITEAGRNQI